MSQLFKTATQDKNYVLLQQYDVMLRQRIQENKRIIERYARHKEQGNALIDLGNAVIHDFRVLSKK